MLVILSPSSVNSRAVMDEVSFALEANKRLIPVVYRECKVPFRLSRIQQVDFRNDYGLALQALLLAIAPIKDRNQSDPSIGAPASETPEQRQLEKRFTKAPPGAPSGTVALDAHLKHVMERRHGAWKILSAQNTMVAPN